MILPSTSWISDHAVQHAVCSPLHVHTLCFLYLFSLLVLKVRKQPSSCCSAKLNYVYTYVGSLRFPAVSAFQSCTAYLMFNTYVCIRHSIFRTTCALCASHEKLYCVYSVLSFACLRLSIMYRADPTLSLALKLSTRTLLMPSWFSGILHYIWPSFICTLVLINHVLRTSLWTSPFFMHSIRALHLHPNSCLLGKLHYVQLAWICLILPFS